MSLNLEQKLQRLKAQTAELQFWQTREKIEIPRWRFLSQNLACEISLGDLWPEVKPQVSLTADARLPEHWPIAESRLRLSVGGESLVTLLPKDETIGGKTSFGLDPNHQEFRLQHREFQIKVESSPRLPFGEPVLSPRLEIAELLWLEPSVQRLNLLLRVLCETCDVIGDPEVEAHLIRSAERALASLNWPSATADYLSRTKTARTQTQIWNPPESKSQPSALTQAERVSVEAAAAHLQSDLCQLQRRFPARGAIGLTGHAHIDLAWLWPYQETRRKLRRTFHSTLALMEQSPRFRFNQSSAQFYQQIEQDDPELFASIQKKVANGQWEPIGGMWVEPDTNLPSGESLIRQVLYGQKYFAEKFASRHAVAWLPDCFGFSPALPQILKQAGLNGMCTIKLSWSETNKFPYDFFWWQGLDGSRVLAHFFDNPDGNYCGDVRPQSLKPTWQNFRGKIQHSETLLAVGHGDGGGGVTPEMLERQAICQDFPILPTAAWTRVDEFFQRLQQSAEREEIPTWVGEMYLELHRGTLTSQAAIKRLNRQLEAALSAIEISASLAHLLGAEFPPNHEMLWRKLLKNQFHDILPGSSIAEVYRDATLELRDVQNECAAEIKKTFAKITANWPTDSTGQVLLIVNPTLSPKPLRAVLTNGEPRATAHVIAPLAIAVLPLSELEAAPGLSVSANHLENSWLRAEISADGTIKSLLHKESGREALSGRGNQLWVFANDKPRRWDAWDLDELNARSGIELTEVESIAATENGPHLAAICITRRYRDSQIKQTYRLYANGRRLEVLYEIDWHERRTYLKAITPVDVRATDATFEVACGVVKRRTHRNTSWEAAQFEAVAHRFVDLSEPGFGVAILNDGKYGHSVRASDLGVSLLRSPIYPDPLADEGQHRFTLAIYPHARDWFEGGVREEAEDLNQPLLTSQSENLKVLSATPLTLKSSGVDLALSALKPAEDGRGLILRIYEPAGGRGQIQLDLPKNWRSESSVSLLEDRLEDRLEDKVDMEAHLKPFEIRSVRLIQTIN